MIVIGKIKQAIMANFASNIFHREVVELDDGWYLSILTGSHTEPSVEVALIRDGHPYKDDYDEAIVVFYNMHRAIGAIKAFASLFDSNHIDLQWGAMWDASMR